MALGRSATQKGYALPTGGDLVSDGDDAITNNALVTAAEIDRIDNLIAGIQTAYDIAVSNGFDGTQQEWLQSLVGPRGPQGPYGGTEVTDPQVASWVKTPSETSDALNARYLRKDTTSASGTPLSIQDNSTEYGHTVYLRDNPAHAGPLLQIHHTSEVAGQTYGLNIANHPGATTPAVIHQYSNRGPSIQIDNTDNNSAIYIKNTDNQNMNPGRYGTGSFLQFLPFGESSSLMLTNDLTWLNNTTKDFQIWAVNPTTYGFSVRVDTDKIGAYINKRGTGPGSALSVVNRGTGDGILLNQYGNGRALNIVSQAIGKAAFRLVGTDSAAVITTSDNGAVTFDIQKSGTGSGTVMRLINRGTSKTISAIGTGGEVFSVDPNGNTEIFTPNAGLFLRSEDGTRYKIWAGNDGTIRIGRA